ncbi:MAG: hypothetical protein ACKO23_21755, partial [Gemmataceae bacterium]
AESWKKYDIRMRLERNWPDLERKLRGKIHVYMGDKDTFYLESSTVLLRDSLRALNSDAKVELFPDKDHGSLMDDVMRKRIAEEMAATLSASP